MKIHLVLQSAVVLVDIDLLTCMYVIFCIRLGYSRFMNTQSYIIIHFDFLLKFRYSSVLSTYRFMAKRVT